MVKGKQSTDNEYNYPSHSDEPVAKEEKKYIGSKEGDVVIMFKQNRRKELHIGNSMFIFEGYQSLKVPRWVITHPDFENQRKEFLVKEE